MIELLQLLGVFFLIVCVEFVLVFGTLCLAIKCGFLPGVK